MYADLVALTDSADLSETREDSLLGDVLAREQAEQEELCDIMSQFYDVIRPEEQMVRMSFLDGQKTDQKILSLLFYYQDK